jgi:hypothetical protein
MKVFSIMPCDHDHDNYYYDDRYTVWYKRDIGEYCTYEVYSSSMKEATALALNKISNPDALPHDALPGDSIFVLGPDNEKVVIWEYSEDMPKDTNLTKKELHSVAGWLTERIAELEPDIESIEEEDPGLISGLRKLLEQLS